VKDATQTTIEAAIREALRSLRPAAAGLDGDADLAQEAGLDSAEVMDLVMEIEDRLDVSIPVETIAEARSINELCAGIARLKHDLA
jgi:acyl carrier protein